FAVIAEKVEKRTVGKKGGCPTKNNDSDRKAVEKFAVRRWHDLRRRPVARRRFSIGFGRLGGNLLLRLRYLCAERFGNTAEGVALDAGQALRSRRRSSTGARQAYDVGPSPS